jgi:hypothetical protein
MGNGCVDVKSFGPLDILLVVILSNQEAMKLTLGTLAHTCQV